MGKMKHLEAVMNFLKKTPVAAIRDIRMLVGDENYTRLLLHNLEKSGRIRRIKKGFYTLRSDPELIVFCIKPSYIGMQDALSIHNLWEQETNVVVITSEKIRTGIRDVFGSNVVIHKLNKKYIFGFDFVKNGDFYIPVSDKEKTLIDLIYFNEIPTRDVLKIIKKNIDRKKLNVYLKLYPKKFRGRVGRILDDVKHNKDALL